MFAIVKDNQIVKTGSLRQLFPKVSFPSGGPSQGWMDKQGVKPVVIIGAPKDDRFYFSTLSDLQYNAQTDRVEREYINIAKLLENRQETDEDGNLIYRQVYDPEFVNEGGKIGGYVTTDEVMVTKGLKTTLTEMVKEQAKTFLLPSDWMIVRKYERNIDVPQETQDYRTAVHAEAQRLETAIQGCSSVEELEAVIASAQWPDPVLPG